MMNLALKPAVKQENQLCKLSIGACQDVPYEFSRKVAGADFYLAKSTRCAVLAGRLFWTTLLPSLGSDAKPTHLVFRMRIIKLIKYIVLSVIFLVLAGATYQSIAERADRNDARGRLIQVGDNTYYLLCDGSGESTLLFESGRWGWHADWADFWSELPAKFRACTYDRLGLGWSSPSNQPTNSSFVVDELHDLLQKAGIEERLIIVGHSLGGYYARKFAERYPQRVAGLVLLDSTHEQAPRRMTYPPEDFSQIELCSMVAWSGALRLFAVMDMLVPENSSAEKATEILSVANRSKFCSGLLNAAEGIDRELRNASMPESLGDTPLVVVRRGKSVEDYEGLEGEARKLFEANEPVWYEMQNEIASLSSRSALLIARESGHDIQHESPQLVVQAIEMIETLASTR